jgi:hypothetical protein
MMSFRSKQQTWIVRFFKPSSSQPQCPKHWSYQQHHLLKPKRPAIITLATSTSIKRKIVAVAVESIASGRRSISSLREHTRKSGPVLILMSIHCQPLQTSSLTLRQLELLQALLEPGSLLLITLLIPMNTSLQSSSLDRTSMELPPREDQIRLV